MSPAEIAARDRRIVRAVRDSDMSLRAAARTYGVSDDYVGELCDRMNVPRPKAGVR
jgi:hypothetical protein